MSKATVRPSYFVLAEFYGCTFLEVIRRNAGSLQSLGADEVVVLPAEGGGNDATLEIRHGVSDEAESANRVELFDNSKLFGHVIPSITSRSV